MFRQADGTKRRGIRTDSWFSWPPDQMNRCTFWRLGPFELQRQVITGHLDMDRTVSAARKHWKLTVERRRRV